MTYTINFPTESNLEGKPFEVLETCGVEKALRKCNDAGYQAVFMPRLVDARIAASKDAEVFKHWFTTPSAKITGRGQINNVSKKGGTPFVIYVNKI
jgi:hypothetical protein